MTDVAVGLLSAPGAPEGPRVQLTPLPEVSFRTEAVTLTDCDSPIVCGALGAKETELKLEGVLEHPEFSAANPATNSSASRRAPLCLKAAVLASRMLSLERARAPCERRFGESYGVSANWPERQAAN